MQTDKIFQNGMILQRDKKICVWGTARPDAVVTVSLQGRDWIGKADSTGKWTISVGPLAVSNKEQLTVTDGTDSLTLSDIAVGDVFLAGGQSNMELMMRYERFYQEELSVCQNDSIRFYDVPECAYDGQDRDFNYSKVGLWRKADRENLEFFSALGYYFAKRLYQELDVPIGIIGLNWGGTRASSWMSEEHARAICPEQVQAFEAKLKGQSYASLIAGAGRNPMNDRGFSVWDPFSEFIMPRTPNREEVAAFFGQMLSGGVDIAQFLELPDPKDYPGALYTHMVLQIAPFGVKAALWYQGESDDEVEGSAAHYAASLSALMSDWRSAWGEELPFLVVQLPGFRSWLAVEGKDYPAIRRAQQQVCDEDSLAFLCSISDLGEEYDIHPKNKRDVGARLAMLALRHLYGADIPADPPRFRNAERRDDHVLLHFDNTGDGLSIRGDTLSSLCVTAAGKEVPFLCTAGGDCLTVQLPPDCEGPVELKFAESGWFLVNLFNSEGIPAIPFSLCC